ncbi:MULTISPECIES: MFS transporter [unclassified Rhodococcus (in: high G+C Gram-positive bacteria)]|uniref:MFS transporter n=1 Tax=unclassified Rhodococcus (in: high G+C Gram-positive bacteria) TaxID=192944 RepID=UPI00163998B7|nr:MULTISPECIES: MFS transporter [unclassified Rhodococcus (in: high G+C Gram-positive bacteria)]MBC2641174.1 MFS transporter [Rhodococcus sp. 3A]MBC2894081.1 MFS transporter [Rhodococcus sp. 4CII]
MGLPTTTADAVVETTAPARRSRMYPWIVFALTFGLLLSDYMSRQVLSAVFPLLKTEWALSDSQLASLSSIVALMVGLLTLPLSLLADRWGRVKSLLLMAVLWSAATLLCALATNYEQMLGARFLVGVGEAAYGSVGIAVVLSVFAPRVHSALSGAFMGGGSFGSVIGVALGGVIAVNLGWRWSFAAMAVFGLILVALFRVLVSEKKLTDAAVHEDPADTPTGFRAPLSSLFTTPAVLLAYVGGGLQMFTAGVLLAWLPSFFNRSYGLAPDKAGAMASIFVLAVGSGMVVCGIITDRVSRHDPAKKWTTAVVYGVLSLVFLGAGFQMPSGSAQLILIGIGAFFSAGSSGPIAAMVANLTHSSVRASAFGTLTLANNLLGLALGPFVVGLLADRFGLVTALQIAPLIYVVAIAALILGKRAYPAGRRKLAALTAIS